MFEVMSAPDSLHLCFSGWVFVSSNGLEKRERKGVSPGEMRIGVHEVNPQILDEDNEIINSQTSQQMPPRFKSG
jgi:hypothetical protein